MRMVFKGLTLATLIAAAAASQAALTYSNIIATVTFDGTDTFNLQVNTDGGSIDFSALTMPMLVSTGNAGGYSTAVVEISYDVQSDDAISGLELIFTGWTFGQGTINYEEFVYNTLDQEIASVSGLRFGDSPFVQTDYLDFGSGYNDYSVEKTFTLNIAQAQHPSLASLGLIEQNAVPEPATMGALAIGAMGLLSRRRRK